MQYPAALARLALIGLVILSMARLGRADPPVNLLRDGGAEEAAEAETPGSPWQPVSRPAEGLRLWLDHDHARSGKSCLAISSQRASDPPVSNNWAQRLRDVPAGRTVRLTGYIRTENAEAANLCVQCWGPEERRMIGYASTPVLRGTHGWTMAQAPDVVVPPATAAVVVRAALTGKGTAYFDDVALSIVEEAGPGDPGLAAQVKGRIVRVLPVTKDCMVLAYLPAWDHGDLDNLAVADNDGGVRTLLQWQAPGPDETSRPALRFLLAVYARETRLVGRPGPIQLHEVLEDWNEMASWKDQPRTKAAPALSVDVTSSKGWKLFDVTAIVRDRAKAGQPSLGVALRFAREDRSGEKRDWSGYQLVSREGLGPWENYRPVLLVVDPARAPPIQSPAAPPSPPAAKTDRK